MIKIDLKTKNRHNGYYTKLNNLRQAIIGRCTKPNYSNYKYYGAKGVRVSDRWLESFDNFYEDIIQIDGWDAEEFMKGNIVLDKDFFKEKLYSLETCLWLSKDINQNLRDNSEYKAISPSGEVIYFSSISAFSKKYGLSYSTVTKRLNGTTTGYYRGWSIPKQKESFYTTRVQYKSPFTAKSIESGEEHTFSSIKEIADFLGISHSRLSNIRNVLNPSKKEKQTSGYLLKMSGYDYKDYYKVIYTREYSTGDTEAFNNLQEYCGNHQLNLTCVSECIHGKQQTHKGSKFYKEEILIS